MLLLSTILLAVAAPAVREAKPALRRSDVVFMYEADPQTYRAYGATAVAWGGKPTPESLRNAEGLRFFGSVGMVTEFARYHDRFPDTYEQGLCRDIHGRPVKVPWLTDMQHKGVPFWWCCTQQPLFRQYLRERVVETVRAGAAGLHVDDHLGTAGGLWLGLCFCDRCLDGFRGYLKSLPPAKLAQLGITRPATYDYRAAVKDWMAADSSGKRQLTQHPLWPVWTAYQCRAAASIMMELRKLAADTEGHPVPVGANAGLLWPRHLADYQALDLFSAETDHHAEGKRFSDDPLVAYRLAESVNRPYTATASGMDWAYVKQHNLPGLVRGWIALSYAAGQSLMCPHRQWCYTPEKGTHWYDGPTEKFAPLYRFVREHADLFDDYETYADAVVVAPHRSFTQDPARWIALCDQLAAANVSYRLALGGDEIVDHPLTTADLARARVLIAPDRESLQPADRRRLDAYAAKHHVYPTAERALAALRPSVRVTAAGVVRALPRVGSRSAVVHLLNYEYDPARDDVRPLSDVRVTLDLAALGIPNATTCRYLAPGSPPVTLSLHDGTVTVPSLGLWGMLVITAR